VKGVNSTGVKAWLDAHRDSVDPPDLLFERCSPPVVRQLNMIPALLKTGRVVSIQAPYFCPACNAETLELLEPGDTLEPAPSRRCAACGSELEFDEIPGQYLVCLTAGAAPTLPDSRGPTDRRR
jgi:DNA-directed RNA polymerase subunit RPC12/RpoP